MVAQPAWAYLAPLKELRGLYRELRLPRWRLRKAGREQLKRGGYAKNPQRMGPIIFARRTATLEAVLDIQARINLAALDLGRPFVDRAAPGPGELGAGFVPIECGGAKRTTSTLTVLTR